MPNALSFSSKKRNLSEFFENFVIFGMCYRNLIATDFRTNMYAKVYSNFAVSLPSISDSSVINLNGETQITRNVCCEPLVPTTTKEAALYITLLLS